MASCIKINSAEKRRNLVAMLSGNVAKVESLLKQNNGKPLPVLMLVGETNISILIVIFSHMCFMMHCSMTMMIKIIVEEIFQKCWIYTNACVNQ